MKKTIYILFSATCAWYMLTSTIDPNNPPIGNTGAPNESTCISSGCHTKGTPTGTVTITGLPDKIAPNTTYTVTVKNSSTNGKATGFQITCLDATDAKCGTFVAGTNVSISTSGIGREYARNSKKTQLVGGAASWTFTWKSPAILTNPKVTFYHASIFGNGDGKENLDGQTLGSKAVTLETTSMIDATLDATLKVFPNPTSDFLNIQLQGINSAEGYLFDQNGRQIKKMYLNSDNQINVKDIAKGNYMLQIWSEGKQTTRKVVLL